MCVFVCARISYSVSKHWLRGKSSRLECPLTWMCGKDICYSEISVRSGIWTHTSIWRPEFPLSLEGGDPWVWRLQPLGLADQYGRGLRDLELIWFHACGSWVACSEKPAWSLLLLLLDLWIIELEMTFFKDAQPDPGSSSSRGFALRIVFFLFRKKSVTFYWQNKWLGGFFLKLNLP